MKCDLSSLISGLKQEFPVECCGDLKRQITDVQKISDAVSPTRQDVLYLIDQHSLLQYQGPSARGPVLCISHTDWNLSHSQPLFPTLIMVLCKDPGRVYTALSRCFYQEGTRVSHMPEVSGAFLRCGSLESLVAKGYEYLKNPFAIHDADGKLLAYTRQDDDPLLSWDSSDFLENLYDFHSVSNSSYMERSRQQQSPVIITPASGAPQMRMALSSRGQTLGYLTVVSAFRPFSASDLQVAELLGCFVTLDLLRQNTIPRINVSDAGRLKGYLETGESNAPEMPQWLEQQRCESGLCFRLILINAVPNPGILFWNADTVLQQLDQLFPGDISTRTEAGVVLLLKSTPALEDNKEFSTLLQQLGSNLVVGVSNPFQSLSVSGHAALRQARLALELGSVLAPQQQCHSYANYAVYAGLRSASGQIDLRELLAPGLLELCESDSGGEMLRTLEVYLSTGGKKARAAELLFIHLNTLKYRLGQISQKLQADLDDPATLFSLEYSLHILRYLKCFGG